MHLADAFIQSDLHCIQIIHFLSVCVFPGNWTHNITIDRKWIKWLTFHKTDTSQLALLPFLYHLNILQAILQFIKNNELSL